MQRRDGLLVPRPAWRLLDRGAGRCRNDGEIAGRIIGLDVFGAIPNGLVP